MFESDWRNFLYSDKRKYDSLCVSSDAKSLVRTLYPLSTAKTFQRPESYYNEDEALPYFPYFPPYYAGNGKFKHFYPTDVVYTLMMLGYKLKEMRNRGNQLFAVVSDENKEVYLHTKPATHLLRLNDETGRAVELKIKGYLTRAYYKTQGRKGQKPFHFPEINYLFNEWVRQYLLLQIREEMLSASSRKFLNS